MDPKPREKSKTRAWEKERRNRLNVAFTKLSEVLPCYDSTKTFSKLKVLEYAQAAIKDLDEKLKNFLCPQDSSKNEDKKLNVSADIIKKLQDRVKKLLVRNEQLSNLLKNAGITVPREYSAVKKFTRRYKDTYKISEAQIKNLQKELEKENQMSTLKQKKTRPNSDMKHKKGAMSSLKGKKFIKKQPVSKIVSSPNCVLIVSQPSFINSSCYILAKNGKKGNQTVITNSLLLKTPIVSSNIKPSSVFHNNPTANLGPGTLILSNGAVMPILPNPQTLPVLPTILNPIQNTLSTLIVVSCSSKTPSTNKSTVSNQTKSTKSNNIALSSTEECVYSNIRPILRPKTCFTKTTQVNKVPIPALSSKHTKHVCVNTKKALSKPNIENKVTLDNTNKDECDKDNKNKRCQPEDLHQAKKIRKEVNEIQPDVSAVGTASSSKECIIKNVSEENIINKEQDKANNIAEPMEAILTDVNTIDNISKNTECEQIESVQYSKENSVKIPDKLKELGKGDNQLKKQQADISSCTTTSSIPELNCIFTKTISKSDCNISTSLSQLKSIDLNLSMAKHDNPELKPMEINLPQSELSNDIFASLQVPTGCQNPESTSPTAAFLMTFPLVSSGVKVTEVIGDENTESQAETPNLLPIGTMDSTKPTQSHSESLTPSLLNLDSFSFFSNRDSCGGFYNNYNMMSGGSQNCSIMTTAASGTNQNTYINSVTNIPVSNNLDTKRNLNTLKNEKINTASCQNNYMENVPSVDRKSMNNVPLKKDMKEHTINRSNHCSNIEQGPQLNLSSFQAKSLANVHYDNKVKPNDALEPFISKPFENCSNYLNYKDCSSVTSNSFNSGKNFNPAYTIAGSNNYFYNSYRTDNDNRNFGSSQCVNYPDYRKADNFFPHYNNEIPQTYNKEKYAGHSNTKPGNQNKLINWMTTPTTTSYKTDYFLPPFSKENEFASSLNSSNTFNPITSNTYFTSSSVYTPSDHFSSGSFSESKKPEDIPLPSYNAYQRPEVEDNQFSWSPNKVPQFLDPAHSFVSSTLPTLVGDLALNNISMVDYKSGKDKTRENRRKVGNYEGQSGQTNFLSVSQLVERESAPGKVSSRRNSGSRAKPNTPKKRVASKVENNYQKVEKKVYGTNNNPTGNLYCDAKQNRNNKVIPSSYSAEALIGNTMMNGDAGKKNMPVHNKSIVPSFLGDNIVPYFPAMDVPQENNYMQSNQGYQSNSFSHNFSSFQNNGYGGNNIIPSACAISTTYIGNNNFMPNANGQEFQTDNANIFQNVNVGNKEKHHYTKSSYNRPTDKDDKTENSCKKNKKQRNSNETNLPSFDIPFLLPGPINSPILPDDFHSTYLPSTTLYSCKNALYSKPGPDLPSSTLIPPLPGVPGGKAGIQHPQISPSVNSAGASLTNFNLSAIFPEINKGPVQEHFSDIRSKDYSISRNFPTTTSIQVGSIHQ